MAERDRLSDLYESAVYEVCFPGGARRFRAGARESDACPEPFAVITAHNPGHERPSAEANEAANAALEADLQHSGLRHLPASGRDVDSTHAEPSFAVFEITEEQALEIARRYGQAAIFWWDGQTGSILWT